MFKIRDNSPPNRKQGARHYTLVLRKHTICYRAKRAPNAPNAYIYPQSEANTDCNTSEQKINIYTINISSSYCFFG